MALEDPPQDDRFSLPTRLGRYRILTPLGSGGMAMVLLARAEGIGGFERDVAIKVLHPHLMDDESLVDQFLKEARIAARIRHPHVVPVLDVGRHSQGVHLVMEYVQGDSLHGLVRRALRDGDALSGRIWMRMLTDALLGLHAAHELRDEHDVSLGVVHRDFTPHNILVGTDGLARLCDFGVVKVVSSTDKTATGIVKGKLRYLAPEQVRARPLDRRCDVWAAGVTTWELLTGTPLYDQRDQVDVLLRIAVEPPPPVRSLCPDVAPALDEAVAWALTIDPDARCPTALAFRDRLLEAWTGHHELASHDEVAARVQQLCAVRLEELTGKMERFQQLRDEMGALVQPLDSDPTPSGQPPRRVPRAQRTEPSEARTEPDRVAHGPGRVSSPGPAEEPATRPELGPDTATTRVDGSGPVPTGDDTITTPMWSDPGLIPGHPAEAGTDAVTLPIASDPGLAEPVVVPPVDASTLELATPEQPSTGARSKRPVLWAAAALLPAALAVAGWQLLGAPPLAAQPILPPLPAPLLTAAPTETTSAGKSPVRLTLVADAPIVELRVDGAVVPLEGASRRVAVPLDRSAGSVVKVRAKSKDGRVIEQDCLVQAGAVRLNFPSPAGKGPRKIAPKSPYE